MTLEKICRDIALKTLSVIGMRVECMKDPQGGRVQVGDILHIKEPEYKDDPWLRFDETVIGFNPTYFRKAHDEIN